VTFTESYSTLDGRMRNNNNKNNIKSRFTQVSTVSAFCYMSMFHIKI